MGFNGLCGDNPWAVMGITPTFRVAVRSSNMAGKSPRSMEV